VALAYLASGILFIMALRGLSSPASSRRGNRWYPRHDDCGRHHPADPCPADGRWRPDAISIAEVLGRSGLAR
jgi:NAD(P) transhydrogenase subunit beta